MSRLLVLGLFLSAWCMGCAASNKPAVASAKNLSSGKVRHIVLFKFKDGTTPEQIKTVEAKFRELPGQIPQIKAFEWGTNISPENKSEGYTHCFLLTFATTADRDAYLPHPAHKAFGAVLHPYLDKVLVIDYVARQ